MTTELQQAIALISKVKNVMADVLAKSIGKIDIVRCVFLSMFSSRPAFLLGPPGTNKTGTIEQIVERIIGAEFFEALMPTVVSVEQLIVESTSIEEVPTANGGKEIRTRDKLGRAANAHLMFADEIWKAEPRVLQTLLDLSKGDGVRHEGQMVKTPLLAFLAASNELPDPDGQLAAMWSRMTIRVLVNPLDRHSKTAFAKSRLAANQAVNQNQTPVQLTLDEVKLLKKARKQVEVPADIIETVLDIMEELNQETAQDFSWAWADDRRFGRIFDVLQANALLDGRIKVGKQDLVVLEWLLWDSPEQIPVVKAKLAPYCRTPLMDAQELLDALLAPSGLVQLVTAGERAKGVQALTQCESADTELKRLRGESNDASMQTAIDQLISQLNTVKADVIGVITGVKKPQGVR